jgi:hypothetical protein
VSAQAGQARARNRCTDLIGSGQRYAARHLAGGRVEDIELPTRAAHGASADPVRHGVECCGGGKN